MKILLIISQVYVLFIAFSGFLFGQLFFGDFKIFTTVAGICGILAGILAIAIDKATNTRRYFTSLFCLGGLIGVTMDAYDYYTRLHVPGNSYAWFLIGPFCFCLLFIPYVALRRRQLKF